MSGNYTLAEKRQTINLLDGPGGSTYTWSLPVPLITARPLSGLPKSSLSRKELAQLKPYKVSSSYRHLHVNPLHY